MNLIINQVYEYMYTVQFLSDWWEAIHTMKVEWRCTTMVNGVQCVMMDGMILMLV